MVPQRGMIMDGYSDDTRYTLTFSAGGYLHEVKTDGWITAELLGVALSVKHGKVELKHNFNGAEAAYRDGTKLWSDSGIESLYA